MALACSDPPEGKKHWTMQLLADRLVELEVVDSVSDERRLGARSKGGSEAVAKAAVVPYTLRGRRVRLAHGGHPCSVRPQEHDPEYPQVCFDEMPYQLIKEKRIPLPAKPGVPQRYDYEYERGGTRNLFMFFESHVGWRHVEVTERRTKEDFAQQMKALVDEYYPKAKKIRLVLDNLNTHTPGALYETFSPEEAWRILDKLEIHYTPKHASWLNMVEAEFSVLANQCVRDRRIGEEETLKSETAAWERERNERKATVRWQFTVEDAREKLKRLYPS